MATRELAEIKDKNGDVNELRDKKLADSIAKNTVVNTDNVRMVDTNGKEVFIARDSFISAIRNVLGGFILSNTKAEAPNIPVFDSNGDFGAITAANLASVLGVGANPNETVNISLTQVGGSSADLIGAAITITDDDTGDTLFSATWNGSTITTEIDVNTNYTVSVETIDGYSYPSPQSYHADFQNERNIGFQYSAFGAYIEATDGTLYTASTWTSSGKTANAIVLITSNTSFKMEIPKGGGDSHNARVLTSTSANINGPKYSDSNAAIDYDGKTNTTAIYAYNNSVGETDVSRYAAPYCVNYTFPDGTKGGYLPAAGQIKAMILNISSINQCLTAIGKNYGLNNYILSSTLSSELLNSEYCCYHMGAGSNNIQRFYVDHAYNTITVKDL